MSTASLVPAESEPVSTAEAGPWLMFVKEIEFERFRRNCTFQEAEEIRQDLEKLRHWLDRVAARDWMARPVNDPPMG